MSKRDTWRMWCNDLPEGVDAVAMARRAKAIAQVECEGMAEAVQADIQRRLARTKAECAALRIANDELQGALNRENEVFVGNLVDTARALGIDPEGMYWLDVLAAFRALAPRLMPEGCEWPCFEDGEPVKPGDMAVIGMVEETVRAIQFDLGTDEVGALVCRMHSPIGERFAPGERVKRPAPKVLDADGVKIREGDTVYVVGDSEPMTVQFYNAGCDCVSCGLEDGSDYDVKPCNLTHTPPERPEPVDAGMDADGTCPNGDGTCPIGDSWERLEEAAHVSPHNYCERHGLTLSDGESFEQAKAKDLVRRAKALAESSVDRPGEVG